MTPVIFRKFDDGDIIALFPTLPSDSDFVEVTCLSYMHIGQHCAASLEIISGTKPAKPNEYKDLLTELQSIGYSDLKVYKRNHQSFFERRKLNFMTSEVRP